MTPTIGCIVHYRLSKQDAEEITSRRLTQAQLPLGNAGSRSAGVFRGNRVEEGDTFPAMIVRTWGDQPDSMVQLQVFLDGNDTHWATSVQVGEGPRSYSWPQRD
jgi:hypothetical protein